MRRTLKVLPIIGCLAVLGGCACPEYRAASAAALNSVSLLDPYFDAGIEAKIESGQITREWAESDIGPRETLASLKRELAVMAGGE